MTFANFRTEGAEVIRPLSRKDPNRCGVLADDIDAMLEYGASRATLAAGDENQVAVYLAPPRYALGGAPGAAVLVRVDFRQRVFRLIHVIDDYVDSRDWAGVARIAAAAI